MKKYIKNSLVLLSYILYEYLFIIGLDYFGINYYKLDYSTKVILILIINLLYMIFIAFSYRKEIKEDIIDFKKNHSIYLSKNLFIYIIGVLLMAFSNIIIQKITNLEISGNEESVRRLIKTIPFYMAFSSILYAPFIEEMIFRKVIKNIINNKYLFILISGILFGILHITNYKDINQILMGIPYIIMGIDFAYIYYKTNNIFTTMTFHLCHNLILFLLQLI